MTMFLQFTIVGVAMGLVYATMAVGLILLVRSVGVLNFAQGDLLLFGAYITYMLASQMKLPVPLIIVVGAVIFIIFGIVFMFTIWWPVRKSSWPQATIVCTIGASYVIREACRLIWGSAPLAMPSLVPGSVEMFGLNLNNQYLVIAAICTVFIAAVFFLYNKMYAGKVMQAATQNRKAATLLGIPVTLTICLTYVLVCEVMGFAGYLVAPIFFVSQNLANFQMRCFAGVIIGGFGNLKGAIVGSIIVGLIESYSAYFTSTYKDVFIFGALLIMLAIRPSGIFGEKISDKA